MKNHRSHLFAGCIGMLIVCGAMTFAADDNTRAQANNPLANTKAFNLQNYYIGDLTGVSGEGNQFWMRYAQPISIGNTNWQHSFAGESARPDVNTGTFQSFMFYQLGDGVYLRSAPIWAYNFENDAYSVPLGLGVGKVFKKENAVYNCFVEPQISVIDDGPGQPEW